ncbi:N-acetylmuramoyl-L-alanine amidase [Clostridium fungisolvens]|uniref:MurNAc-LAA domain-containing protein n=1 Tax=Clostridium fungisolvens TaxID=1604897 RepID=A0A6V8SCT1_9CLOT|nr:N-acetylmuramoyl-L-alanine amidase [Clostridium fungisolvens]GFP74265.1 hypothetical protein bsdtw1_00310 [Clostridium fungisolvens]
MRKAAKIVVINILTIIFTLSIVWTSGKVSNAVEEDMVKVGIESPLNIKSDLQQLYISGWAVAKGQLKNIEVILDGKSLGNANYGFYRRDIGEAFTSYSNSYNSGFVLAVPDDTSEGKHKIQLKISIIDRNNQSKDFVIEKQFIKATKNLESKLAVEDIKDEDSLSGELNISGWSLISTGTSRVQVLLDGSLLGDAQYGYSRKDVANSYSQYFEADNCGYNFKIAENSVSNGKHKITIKALGNNNEIISKDIVFYYNLSMKSVAAMELSNDSIVSKTFTISGWALNAKNIEKVKVYFDWKYVGDATYGYQRLDIGKAYRDYPNSSNSGFSYQLDISQYADGDHSVMVQPIGKDGSILNDNALIRNVMVANKTVFYGIDERLSNLKGKTSAGISGWVTSPEKINDINIFVDWKYIGKANYKYTRKDVPKKYLDLQGENIGFGYSLDLLKLTKGTHTFMIQFITESGNTKSEYFNFEVNRFLIVVDPGHNNAGDDGAYSTIDGETYCERELNMQVAVKLKSALENKGYIVLLTRQPLEILLDDLSESLAKRVNLANSLNADLFISIHHDKNGDASVSGVSTHYSSYRPDLDNDGIIRGQDPGGWSYTDLKIDSTPSYVAVKSRELANKLVSALSSDLNRNNLKAHDHGLNVTRNTKMPSVLVECGFISNKGQAQDCSDDSIQEKTAKTISETIASCF